MCNGKTAYIRNGVYVVAYLSPIDTSGRTYWKAKCDCPTKRNRVKYVKSKSGAFGAIKTTSCVMEIEQIGRYEYLENRAKEAERKCVEKFMHTLIPRFVKKTPILSYTTSSCPTKKGGLLSAG